MAAKKSLKCQTLMFQTFKGIEKRDVPRQGSRGQATAQGPSPRSQGGVGGSATTRGAPASKVGRSWPSGSSFVPCRLALIQLYPPSAMRCPLLHPKSVRSASRISFFLKTPLREGVSAWGRLENARNTCTWMGKVHVWGAGSYSLPGLNAQQTHLNPPESHPLSLGGSRRPPVPPSPPVPAQGPPVPHRLCNITCQEQGQPQVSPKERKQQSPAHLSVLAAGGETPVGWAQGRGLQGRSARVTLGLVPNSCSHGGTRFPGRLIPFGAHLPHRYSFDIKPIYTVQWQVPALLKKKGAFPARIMHISMPDPGESEALLMHGMTLNKALNPANIYSPAPCSLHLFV